MTPRNLVVLVVGCALVLLGFFTTPDQSKKEAGKAGAASVAATSARVDPEDRAIIAADSPRAAADEKIEDLFEKDFDEGFDDLTLTPPPSGDYVSPENLPEMIPESTAGNESNTSRSGNEPDDAGDGYLTWPIRATLTSRFGPRGRQYHWGIDLGASYGAEFRAAAEGVVTFSGWYYNYGRTVIIRHPNGWQTLYAHASRLLVSEGERVSKGQAIGLVGSSGRSTGAHLHFEVVRNGRKVNPLPLLP